MTDTIIVNGRGIDLSARIAVSTTVVASPALAAETIIGSVTLPSGLTYASGVILRGWAAYTVGTSGVSVTLKIRQTSVSGTTIATTGLTTATAADLYALTIDGFDTAPGDAQVYKFTMTVGSGAAASTVSALQFTAIAV